MNSCGFIVADEVWIARDKEDGSGFVGASFREDLERRLVGKKLRTFARNIGATKDPKIRASAREWLAVIECVLGSSGGGGNDGGACEDEILQRLLHELDLLLKYSRGAPRRRATRFWREKLEERVLR